MSLIAVVFFLLSGPAAYADQFDDQINAARQQAAAAKAQANQYHGQANDALSRIRQLNAQIGDLEAQINFKQAQANKVTADINDANIRMAKSKEVLSQNIKTIYLTSDVSALEMIASSNNFSEYFNKQQYQDKVKNKIESTLAEITALKKSLEDNQAQLTKVIADQKDRQQALAATRNEAAQLLALASQNAAAADQQVQAANTQINSLRAAQAASFAKFSGSTSGSGAITFKNLSFGGACGGGYPSTKVGSNGLWGCAYDTDRGVDDWDLYNRECVSYAAWAIDSRGGNVPRFSGRGNAYEWPSYLGSHGYRVDSNPAGERVVAIIPQSIIGGVGHAMVVENGGQISGGYIRVSQYNWWPTNNGPYGIYSTMDIKPAGLIFIHF